MTYNKFETRILIKFLLITCFLIIGIYVFVKFNSSYYWLIPIACFIIIALIFKSLFKFVTKTNYKLVQFLESITYSDFSLKFVVDTDLNDSFNDLNSSFNTVIEAFQQERLQKEEHLRYLNTIIKHVNIGLIAFEINTHKVEFINKHAKILLETFVLKNLKDFKEQSSELYDFFKELSPKKNQTFYLGRQKHLAAFATILRLSNKTIKIIAIQNIYKELQAKEIETWQKLTSVLRHEIMNSITPITSISETLRYITTENFEVHSTNDSYTISSENLEDLREGITIINERTSSLIDFVNAYRDYTNLPQPIFKNIHIPDLVKRIQALFKIDFQSNNIQCDIEYKYENELSIVGDFSLLEMVLINLVKNAMDALKDVTIPKIHISSKLNQLGNPIISIKDNGAGISDQAIEKIFIPFYTTKQEGSGIGLSLSQQIMEMHNGSIHIETHLGKGSTFTLSFNKT